MVEQRTLVEILVRQERRIVLAGLTLITLISWWWVLVGAGTGMNTWAMTTWQFPPPVFGMMFEDWTLEYAVAMFFMWWIMMIAMMTPSAAPMVLLYAGAYRHEQRQGKLASGLVPTFAFAIGYLAAWAVFSLIATGLQWGLEHVGLIHQMKMWSISPAFSGTLLLAAGIYQLTPFKEVCLKHCRSPAQFLSDHFKPGKIGAFNIGWRHGLYCLGCCWFLMALLFAGGIMNLVWIAGLAIFVLIEKIAPFGHWIARIAGVAMIAAGVWMLVGS